MNYTQRMEKQKQEVRTGKKLLESNKNGKTQSRITR